MASPSVGEESDLEQKRFKNTRKKFVPATSHGNISVERKNLWKGNKKKSSKGGDTAGTKWGREKNGGRKDQKIEEDRKRKGSTWVRLKKPGGGESNGVPPDPKEKEEKTWGKNQPKIRSRLVWATGAGGIEKKRKQTKTHMIRARVPSDIESAQDFPCTQGKRDWKRGGRGGKIKNPGKSGFSPPTA